MSDKNRQKKESMTARICKSLDISSDILPYGSLCQLKGRSELLLTGCNKILIYTPEEIKIALHRDVMSVSGKKLLCISYHKGEIGISGEINCLSFIDGEEKK